MDDLGEKLSKLLSSPDAMEKIQSAMAAFNGDGTSPAPTPSITPPSAPLSPTGGLPDLSTIAKLAPLLGSLGQESDDTRLLQALRPYLHGQREQRLDETMRLLRLLRLLPLLQESGLGNLLSQGGIAHGE